MKYIVVFYFSAMLSTFIHASVESAKDCAKVPKTEMPRQRCIDMTLEEDMFLSLLWPVYWRDRYMLTFADNH
jgi:hypothetical protein